jgi:ribosomal protein L11 methyltransferase
LSDCDTAAIHELSDEQWRVFFRAEAERDAAHVTLATSIDAPLSISALEVPDEDWARRSQASLRAIRIGALLVAPPWDIPNPTAEPLVIVIEPSTGFGTGHHATTRLCLRALQRIPLEGRTVVDVGTGSGVLALAAARLGAASVIAFDDDPDAIDAARANLARNVSPPDSRIDLRVDSLDQIGGLHGDVVLANLAGALLRTHATALARLALGGTLIVSGLLTEEADAIRAAFADLSASLTREDEDGWTAFTISVS